MSYSHKKCYMWSLSIKGEDIIQELVEAINYFGGVTRELVIDNAKQILRGLEVRSFEEFDRLFLGFTYLSVNLNAL